MSSVFDTEQEREKIREKPKTLKDILKWLENYSKDPSLSGSFSRGIIFAVQTIKKDFYEIPEE